IAMIILFYKELVTLSFDEDHASISGIHAKRIHFLFIILTALVIAATMRIVGVLLVSALMTLPVAAAMRLTKSFKQTMFISMLFGELAVIIGLVTGYYFSIPPGGTIVMVSVVILLLAIFKNRTFSKINKKEEIHLLKQECYKNTKRSIDILDFFLNEDRYRTAKDLNEFIEKKYPGISFDTVYRNLHLYNSIGILETTELNGEKQFRMK